MAAQLARSFCLLDALAANEGTSSVLAHSSPLLADPTLSLWLLHSMLLVHDRMAHPMRIVVCVCVSDIPGNPQARHIALGDAVCRDLFSRKLHTTVCPAVYDHVHIPGDFDSDQPLKRWFIFDLNVKETLSRNDVTRLPHLVYRASREGDKWIFISRDKWTETARSRAASYTWGGRSEQKLVSEMRKQNTNYDAS
ncbi:hypothetical protein BDV06DRAFT_220758 [Aspergillus oleicola]